MQSGVKFIVVTMVLAAGCPGDDGDDGKSSGSMLGEACEAVEACTSGGEKCEAAFQPLVPPPGCFTAIETASCEEHAADDPSYTETCFPPCDAEMQRCNGDDTVTKCTDLGGTLRELKIDCKRLCAAQDLPYSGVCGTTWEHNSSPDEVCWCEASGEGVAAGGSATDEDLYRPCQIIDDQTFILMCEFEPESSRRCTDLLADAYGYDCQGELADWTNCLESVPDGQWECDEYGWATPKLGGCDPDREALDACIMAGTQ